MGRPGRLAARGYWVTGTALLWRRGVLPRELDVVPDARRRAAPCGRAARADARDAWLSPS